MPKITIQDDGKTFEAQEGKRLVLAIEDAGYDILHRCGGFARCTTCRVQVISGDPDMMTQAERDRLAQDGLVGKVRLSCQIPCQQDMTVKLISRLSGSDYADSGNRPQDEITPEPVWLKTPR